MKINVKFANRLTEEDVSKLAATIRKLGATAVRPLNPDIDDEELRRLFIVDADDSKLAAKLLDEIRKIPGVEFAHLPAQRRLIR
jgi:cell division protein FtsX